MLRTGIILVFIVVNLEWIVGVKIDGGVRRNKTELRTNKRIQETRRFDNMHTNVNKMGTGKERSLTQPLRCFYIWNLVKV